MPTDNQKVKSLTKIKNSIASMQKKVNDICDTNIKLIEDIINEYDIHPKAKKTEL